MNDTKITPTQEVARDASTKVTEVRGEIRAALDIITIGKPKRRSKAIDSRPHQFKTAELLIQHAIDLLYRAESVLDEAADID